MDDRLARARQVVRSVVREVRREDVTFMAASIAYHAFVSMLPILVLLTLAASAVGSERFVETVVELTRSVLPAAGRRVVIDALRNATGDVGLSVVGIAVLLWGTAKIFRAMDAAFAEIYDTERKLSLLDQLRDALVVALALAAAAVAAVSIGSFLRVPATVPFAGVLDEVVSVAGLAVAFFPMYYVFPNTDVSPAEVLPGVLVAAVGWVGLEWLFGLYVAVSNRPDVYGLVGTLLLLVTWLYAGGLLLLVGAAVNATLAGRDGNEPTWSGKRRFGRQVTDAESFDARLDVLVGRARDAGVGGEELARRLRRRADGVEAGGDEASRDEARVERG